MVKILLVEDNEEIWENIKEYLIMEWYDVDRTMNWYDWLEKANKKTYDILLFDIMLPWLDWIQLLRKFREKHSAPVIMTTAKWEIEDKTDWFWYGADDYLVKPFSLEELVLRIKAILKRTEIKEIFTYQDVEINIEENLVKKDWIEVKLTLKEFLILAYLIENKNIVSSRTDLIEYIWWWEWLFDNDSKLDVYVSNIRKKLNKDLIETVKWLWYRINLDI